MTNPAYEPLPTDIKTALQSETDPAAPRTVALRLAALRAQLPETVVRLDTVRADDTAIAINATIGRTGGGRASAIAAVDVDADRSWADQLAEVEAAAIAKALDQLGVTLERAQQQERPAAKPQAQAPQKPAPAPQQSAPPQAKSAEDDHLPEFSWNAFWQQAHTHNITREQVEQALGRSVREASPQEAITALKAAGSWPA